MKKQYSKFLLLAILLKSMLVFAQIDATCVQTLRGVVRDRVTDSLLTNAAVIIMDNNGNIIATQKVNDKAAFLFNLKCGKEYELKATMQDYTDENKRFTTADENGSGLKTVVFLDKGKIDFVFDPVSDVKSEDVTEVANESLVTITDIATPEKMASVITSEESKVADNSLNKELSDKMDSVTGLVQDTVQSAKKDKKIKVFSDSYVTNISPIYFDLGSSYFNKKAKEDLKRIFKMLNINPKMEIEIGANSDAQGTSKYNKWLSDRRANRVKEYLVSRGIKENRISTNSFGDSHLINRCAKGVDCTDEEHAKNRRVEFVIVKM